MEIRPAVRADGPAICGLICDLADFENLPAPDAAAQSRLVDDAFGENPRLELWVAEEVGRVVAYGALVSTYSTFRARPTLFLEDLFVHPDSRRRGIGAAMMRRFRALAEERGCGRFEWLVLAWNRDAIRFYEGLGAEVFPDWRMARITL